MKGLERELLSLKEQLEGSLELDAFYKQMFATDASIYKQYPLAVCFPENKSDIQKLIHFALANKTSLIPRTAGTSLAGQCVGGGIVVDVSKHFTKIIELNEKEQWVKVEPGVIRDELNAFLATKGLFFGPNTSTANRCMMGGMVGNNSSGTTSIKYGVTRDHVMELEVFLSDGTEAVISPSGEANSPFHQKINNEIQAILNEPGAKEDILDHFPKKDIHRRNTGYALDLLLEGEKLDLTKLLTGSEGTLAFTTSIKLHVDRLPPSKVALVCAHFNSIHESMEAVLVAMKSEPFACELMDKIILDCTKNNLEQAENRFFVEGDPAAVLVTELRSEDENELKEQVEELVSEFKRVGLGYAFPVVEGSKADKVWSLRAAGLGLLSNVPGDAKPIACIEDTAVDVNDLPAYIDEFESMMEDFEQKAVYYAHAGAGELHLRPIVNLKEKEGRQKFREICQASAALVKKYKGSLSGEHGDGRVRAEFIPMMVGVANYKRFQRVKEIWDPQHIFNPGKIVNAPPIDEDLRYEEGQQSPEIDTILDFSDNEGILQTAEKCNGSADCRKLTGAMCPSYQATKDEKDTTRARANLIREVLTQGGENSLPLANEDLKKVLDLCVSCKACKRECPSNIDMAALKSEVLYQYREKNGSDLRTKSVAFNPQMNKQLIKISGLYNAFAGNKVLSGWIKKAMGVAQERSLPLLGKESFEHWLAHYSQQVADSAKQVYLFIDEFTNYNDVKVGQDAVKLLNHLGYEVRWKSNEVSGRTFISKGFLKEAKECARKNVNLFKDLVDEKTPLIGLEPSAILSFRDEYPSLLKDEEKLNARTLGKWVFTIDEFLWSAHQEKSLTHYFTDQPKQVKVHVHCHQKALSKMSKVAEVLSIPENYSCSIIPGGCCGMAGSFGYEKEHFEISKKMAHLNLIPAVEHSGEDVAIVASGTSCRHQIGDLSSKEATHPVELLYRAIKRN